MTEKDMEELIKLYPEEFFDEELKFVGNQLPVSSGRITNYTV